MEVKKIFVVGAGGLMGNGIVQVFIEAGFDVIANDIKEEFVQRGVSGIDKRLDRKIEKGQLAAEKKPEIMARLTTSTDLADAKDADVVIEAVFEDMALKQQVFARLDEVCPPHTILTSNSSSMPITEIAGATKRQDRVMGMHFIQPVPVMPLIDTIRGLLTSDETYNTIDKLGQALGKQVIEWTDGPGHGLQLSGMAYYNEVAQVLYEKRGTKEDVDKCFKVGMDMNMGPVTTLDFMGLDTTVHILGALDEGYGGTQFRPCQLLVQMVHAGLYGTKTGRGFYTHTK